MALTIIQIITRPGTRPIHTTIPGLGCITLGAAATATMTHTGAMATATMPGDHRGTVIPADMIGAPAQADMIEAPAQADMIEATGQVDTTGATAVIVMTSVCAMMAERVQVVTIGKLVTTGTVTSAECRIVNHWRGSVLDGAGQSL